MGLFRNVSGQVRVRITSADITGCLAAVNAAGIIVTEAFMPDELTAVFTISRRDWRPLAALTKRRGETLRLEQRRGIYWDLKNLSRRPVFILGLVLLLCLAMYLPSRIFLIEVQGNTTIPSNRILETAADCGIGFGASRREVRSEKVKNALLEAMPELSWAGVNTYGCRAVITVRQRDVETREAEEEQVTSIVAARDGYILRCDVVSGNGLCVPGQAVKAGQVLISGYTDCGICITATRSEGEVVAATSHTLTAVTPANCMKRTAQTGEEVRYSLIVGKNRINFYNCSGISDGSCGRMVTEYILTLPGGYPLPVKLVKETLSASRLSQQKVAQEEAGTLLKAFASRYLATQMIAGTITERLETVVPGDGLWRLTGNYACTEMIGRVRVEQNGE